MGFINTENVYTSKDTIKKVRRHPTGWVEHPQVTCRVRDLCLEYMVLTRRRDPILKMAKGLE